MRPLYSYREWRGQDSGFREGCLELPWVRSRSVLGRKAIFDLALESLRLAQQAIEQALRLGKLAIHSKGAIARAALLTVPRKAASD